ncbi:MAG: hypothetical protein U0931_35900 [Vulcanimicrobiota bacterium]
MRAREYVLAVWCILAGPVLAIGGPATSPIGPGLALALGLMVSAAISVMTWVTLRVLSLVLFSRRQPASQLDLMAVAAGTLGGPVMDQIFWTLLQSFRQDPPQWWGFYFFPMNCVLATSFTLIACWRSRPNSSY